jgi:mono/diheme cytochrome c family protein
MDPGAPIFAIALRWRGPLFLLDSGIPTVMKKACASSFLLLFGLAGVLHADGPAKAPDAIAELYKTKCQICHMVDGNSPLEPMNFADGKWKHGSKPAEVAKVIEDGVPATAMLPFKEQLTAAEITKLAAYVRAFDPALKPGAKGKGKPAPKGGQ